MKLKTGYLAIAFCFSVVSATFLASPVVAVYAQDATVALQRGYRTGYSDGYMAGYRDVIDNSSKNAARHSEYGKADRAYNKDYGKLDDYRDGYQQGFESGYETGFTKKAFDATVPSTLATRGVKTTSNTATTKTSDTKTPPTIKQPENTSKNTATTTSATAGAIIIIPQDTEFSIELLNDLDTDRNREGDKFTARILAPVELEGAMIEGRIAKLTRPGRVKRRAEMLLSFDRILLADSRWANFNAVLTEISPLKDDNVKRVDTEGSAIGKSSVKSDSVKVGAAAGTGLVVGAVVAGPVGAAVGAGVGAAFGVGAIVMERGKNINLTKQQQLKIRTSFEIQIR